jgi:hypothetical protein
MNQWVLIAAIFALNLPFGAWRARVRKFTPAWFLAIHVPVVFAVVLRLSTGIGFHAIVLLESAAAFFAGQFAGGWLWRWCRVSPVRAARTNRIMEGET